MTYHDIIYHDYGFLLLLFTIVVAIFFAFLRHSKIEKRIKSQPNFTANDWLFSTSSHTGVAIDVDRKVLLLVEDARTDRRYEARDLNGCEMLLDGAAIILRISVNDFDRPHHDVVVLESPYSKKRIRGDDPVARRALQIAEQWHERIMALIRTAGATEPGRNAISSATRSPTPVR